MVIKRSAGQEVASLIVDLGSADETRRESAIARLAVIGARAVERLLAVAADPSGAAGTRQAALQALEAIGDLRALRVGLACAAEADPLVRRAAVDLLRRLLTSDPGMQVLDRLTARALDPTGSDLERLAALDALADLPARTVQPILDRLAHDPSAAIRQRAASAAAVGPVPAPDRSATPGGSDAPASPDTPDALREVIGRSAVQMPLPTLHRLVTVAREREESAGDAASAIAWRVARGAVHRALAERDSRVALYDLREALTRTSGRLPVDYLAALERIGDASCLEPLAEAYRSAGPEDEWWKRHVGQVFQAIIRREKLTRRHQVLKRLQHRYADVLEALLA